MINIYVKHQLKGRENYARISSKFRALFIKKNSILQNFCSTDERDIPTTVYFVIFWISTDGRRELLTLKFQWNAFRQETRRRGNLRVGEKFARKRRLYFPARGVRERLAQRKERGAAFYLEKTVGPTCEQCTKSPRDVPIFFDCAFPLTVTNDWRALYGMSSLTT